MGKKVIYLAAFIVIAGLGFPALSAQDKTLRVCADPDYLPFSNRAGEGFENKIAQAVAKALGEKLEYTWASYRGKGGFNQFLSRTLEAKQCDLVMDMPYGSREERTTQPYYVSSYVFVFKKSKNYDITSLDSPILQQLKVGFESDTPVEDGLKLRDMVLKATAFDVADDESVESPNVMLDAIEKGEIDVMITWEPAIGGFLSKHDDLEVVAVPNSRSRGTPEQYAFPMSMAVREDDTAMEKAINDVIANHQSELTDVLNEQGVRLYTPQ
jgi:mxaJ protein